MRGLPAAKDEGRAALMPYMMAGYPDLETSRAVAESYAEYGADLVELGVPFSDPLADGPTIHAAATAALKRARRWTRRWRFASRFPSGCRSSSWSTPTWCWPTAVPRRSPSGRWRLAPLGRSCRTCRWRKRSRCGRSLPTWALALVPLVAPTTPAERRARICAAAQGFVYVVSTVGTTGERDELPPQLGDLVVATKAEARGSRGRRLRYRHAGSGCSGRRGRRRRDHRQPSGPCGWRGGWPRGRGRGRRLLPARFSRGARWAETATARMDRIPAAWEWSSHSFSPSRPRPSSTRARSGRRRRRPRLLRHPGDRRHDPRPAAELR